MPPRQRPNATHATTRVPNQTAASPGCSIATRTQPHTATADTSRSFGTRLVREGHDLVVVAELLGHARLDQTRRYSLPTQADRQRAINSLLTDN